MQMPNGKNGFVGNDVTEVLVYANPRKVIFDLVDEEDKQICQSS